MKALIEEILEHDWTEADLRRAAELHRELERSASLREQLREFDRLREVMHGANDEAEPTGGGWAGFESRLLSTLATRPHRGEATRGVGLRHVVVPWALAASVALMVLGWGLYFRASTDRAVVPGAALSVGAGEAVGRPRVSHPPTQAQPGGSNGSPVRLAGSFARMSPQDVNQQAQLFEQVSEVFDARAGWVAVTGNDVSMDLVKGTPAPDSQVLLLRLALSRSGTLMSRTDLAIVPGQAIDLTMPLEGNQRVRYRLGTTTSTPTRLSVWVEMQSPDRPGEPLAALSTELAAKPGDLLKVGELTTSSGEYRIELGVFRAGGAKESS